MHFGRSVENFTIRELPMHTKQRTERTELIPTGHLLSPLFQILFIWFFITMFNCKAAYIHCPVWNAAHAEIDACRNLRLHIFPPRSNVTAPCCSSIPL